MPRHFKYHTGSPESCPLQHTCYACEIGTSFAFRSAMSSRSRLLFLVGPNGSGKTRRLIDLAKSAPSGGRTTLAIAGTPFTAFPRNGRRLTSFSISPKQIPRVVAKNLVQFFDAEGRDTFDMSDLLSAIGLEPVVDIKIEINEDKLDEISDLFRKTEEARSISSALQFLRSNEGRATLSQDSSGYTRSLRGQNRLVFKNIRKLQRSGIVKSFDLIFLKRENYLLQQKEFSKLSSGEQTIISTYLFIKANLDHLDLLIIDEPENSLHPDWQRQYMKFIHMAIGYSEAEIVMATHSPILVSGTLANYPDDSSVIRVADNAPDRSVFAKGDEPGSVEEILWKAFQTITPTNHFLSAEISDLLQNVIEGEISQAEATKRLEEFRERSYDQTQSDLISQISSKIPTLAHHAESY